MAAVVHDPGEGELHEMGANAILIKATSEDTDGRFFLSESTIEPGFPGPPPHVHDELVDMFYRADRLEVRLPRRLTHAAGKSQVGGVRDAVGPVTMAACRSRPSTVSFAATRR